MKSSTCERSTTRLASSVGSSEKYSGMANDHYVSTLDLYTWTRAVKSGSKYGPSMSLSKHPPSGQYHSIEIRNVY